MQNELIQVFYEFLNKISIGFDIFVYFVEFSGEFGKNTGDDDILNNTKYQTNIWRLARNSILK